MQLQTSFVSISSTTNSIRAQLRSILSGPFSCSSFVLGTISLVECCNVWHKRIIWIWVRKHRADRKKDFGNCQGGTPLIFQNVEADGSVRVDVWMVALCRELNFGWFEWVVAWESNREEENTAGIRRVTRSHNRRLPFVHVVASRTSRAWWRGIST